MGEPIMFKEKRKPFHKSPCMRMTGRSTRRDPVWQRLLPSVGEGIKFGPPFIIDVDANEEVYIPWWRLERYRYVRIKAPHLTYNQTATAAKKSREILKALRQGHLTQRKGFIYSRANRLLMTRAVAKVVIAWMEAVGFVFTREPLNKETEKIDLDFDACERNGVI